MTSSNFAMTLHDASLISWAGNRGSVARSALENTTDKNTGRIILKEPYTLDSNGKLTFLLRSPESGIAVAFTEKARGVTAEKTSFIEFVSLDHKPEIRVFVTDTPNTNSECVFAGENVVFTGALDSMTRTEASTIAKNLGGNVQGSITRSTTLVIAGAAAGTKLNKARAMGITIIDEQQFLKTCGRCL